MLSNLAYHLLISNAMNTQCQHSTKLTGQCVKCGQYPYNNPMNTTKQSVREADDLLREANHKLIEENKRLKSALSKAWTLGANHSKPNFDTLNEWRNILNQ